MDNDLELLLLKQKKEWLENEAPKIHSAFSLPPGGWNDQRAVQKQKKPVYYLNLSLIRSNFSDIKSALERYRALEGCSNFTIDPTQCSWAEVFRLLSEAKRAYNKKGEGISGSLRKAFRSAGDHVEDIKPFVEFIPDEIWGSALRISLGWIFSLLATAAKNREKILTALEDIPNIIVTAEAKLKHFLGDIHVTELVYNLFDTVFEVTTKLLTYLLPKHIIFKVFPGLADAPSGSDISLAIEKINRAVVALNQQSDILRESILVNTNKHVHKASQDIQSELHVVRQGISEVKVFQQQDSHDVKEALSSSEMRIINAVRTEANDAARSAGQGMSKLCDDIIDRLIVPMIQARDRQFEMDKRYLLERVEELELERARTPQPLYGPTNESPTWNLSIPDVQNIICAPFQAITNDFDNVIRQGHQFDHMLQSQAYWVLRQDRLRQWMLSDSSDIIVVHGDLTASSGDANHISSLSVVCATMAAGLIRASSHAITLYYFCGLHMSSHDDLEGPQGLLRILIGRLLLELDTTSGYKPNLKSMDSSFIQGLQSRDIRHLCALFSSLLALFATGTTIYCMLDGITWYDRSNMRNDLRHIMQTIRNLVSGPSYSRCQLKVLITSPFRSTELTFGFPPDKQIVLEPETMMLEASSGEMLQKELGLVGTGTNGSRQVWAQTSGRCPSDEVNWTADDYE